MFYQTSDGVSVHYIDEGISGIPVVMVHGWTMDGTVFAKQSGISRCRLIAVDLRGHGQSDRKAKMDLSFQRMAQDIYELLEHLDLTGVVLVGWSMGVTILLSGMTEPQHRIAAYVFIGGTPKFLAGSDYPFGMRELIAQRLRSGLEQSFKTVLMGFYQLLFVAEVVDAGVRESLTSIFAGLVDRSERQIALDTLDELYQADLRSVLDLIRVPVLIVCGTLDKICFAASALNFQEGVREGQLALLEGVGHMPFYTQAEAFNKLLTNFISGLYEY